MCRFALYLGPPTTLGSLVTQPEHSIIRQSLRSDEGIEPLNGDGFGVGWYRPELSEGPAVFKDLTPAWSNANLLNLAPVTVSSCILAHVRSATPGLPVTRLNCHPFGWGRFAFMHNGHLAGFHSYVRRLRSGLSDEAYRLIQGSTDSEHLFALFVDAWRALEGTEEMPRMVRALAEAIGRSEEFRRSAGIEEPSLLNLALTDGSRAVVTRWISPGAREERANSLYYHPGRCYTCEAGVGRMEPAADAVEEQAVIIASEPLTHDATWRRVPPNHAVVVSEEVDILVVPIVI